MSNKQKSFVEHMFRHLMDHGIIAMLIAGYYLVELRGVEARQFILFGIPPLVAVLFTRHGKSVTTRSMAWSFLGMVGVGSLIAATPALFPNLGGIDRQLGVHHDRMLSWYTGVYIVWVIGVLPICLFRKCLKDHREGRSVLPWPHDNSVDVDRSPSLLGSDGILASDMTRKSLVPHTKGLVSVRGQS